LVSYFAINIGKPVYIFCYLYFPRIVGPEEMGSGINQWPSRNGFSQMAGGPDFRRWLTNPDPKPIRRIGQKNNHIPPV
jgi:hypothetical protein